MKRSDYVAVLEEMLLAAMNRGDVPGALLVLDRLATEDWSPGGKPAAAPSPAPRRGLTVDDWGRVTGTTLAARVEPPRFLVKLPGRAGGTVLVDDRVAKIEYSAAPLDSPAEQLGNLILQTPLAFGFEVRA